MAPGHDNTRVVHQLGPAARRIPSHPAGESPRGVDLGNPSSGDAQIVEIAGWVLKLRRKDDLMLAPALVQIAAVSSASLIGLVIIFHVALATGAHWGSAAYGGRFVEDSGQLPTRHRATSAVAAIALLGVAWLILAAGSAFGRGPIPEGVLTLAMWAAAALFALNTLGNLSGTHPVERFGASGLTAVLTVLCLMIAVGR